VGRKTKDSGLDGVAVIDKPAGWTSHDVVGKCRALLGQRRAGHSGTLDPDATGLLLVGFGVATRLLPYLTILPKTYTCEVVLGSETSTLDASGDVTATFDMSGVGLDQVRSATRAFVGDILQIPPMVSAVQVDGKRLHQYAREGIEVERKPRPVTVHSFDVHGEVAPGVFSIEVTCSSGTYVRTLAADLGNALGGGAHLRELRRTRIVSFGMEESVALTQLTIDSLLTPCTALRDYPYIVVEESQASLVRTGRVFDATDFPVEGEGPWRVVDASDAMLAVYERRDERLAPAVVLQQRSV
jgi:tRNA pseudouridine55 synthase